MTAILFSEMAPEAAWEENFNTWYDTDHIPVRMMIEGFEGAQRYRAAQGDNYLVVYDLVSLDVLKGPEYDKVKTDPTDQTKWMLANVRNFTRYLGNEIGRHGFTCGNAIAAPMVFATMFDVPTEHLAAFDAWMTDDHIPMLGKGAEWLGARRFELTVAEPRPFNRLTIHYLSSSEWLESDARKAARGTEWRARMAAEHEWFNHPQIGTFHCHGKRFGPA
ncbi:MAG: hypothetical protein PHI71_18130 [Acidiphilium sp.]|nr:hypothetical protein [Acidiphilium sp.]